MGLECLEWLLEARKRASLHVLDDDLVEFVEKRQAARCLACLTMKMLKGADRLCGCFLWAAHAS